MFPMVATVSEIRQASKILEESRSDLLEEGKHKREITAGNHGRSAFGSPDGG